MLFASFEGVTMVVASVAAFFVPLYVVSTGGGGRGAYP